MKKIIFSGVQPSGQLMLGNYLGAIRNWVQLQDDPQYDCLYCIVDLHAITVRQDPEILRERTYDALAYYIACGIEPYKVTLFAQSHNPQHTELAWILGCFASMGELSRMTQFKDKSAQQKHIGSGLFTYPVLMAADILLYQTNLVPVGHDQKQHLELTRDLAERINHSFGKQNAAALFQIPEPYIAPVGAKIMSLAQPTQKMSKSDPDQQATITLADTPDEILKKFKKAVTDSGSEITDSEDKPGIRNLLTIQSTILKKPINQLVQDYQGKQYGHLKVETAEIVIELLKPIQQQFRRWRENEAELDLILSKGKEKAMAKGEATLQKVKDAVGFVPEFHQ